MKCTIISIECTIYRVSAKKKKIFVACPQYPQCAAQCLSVLLTYLIGYYNPFSQGNHLNSHTAHIQCVNIIHE